MEWLEGKWVQVLSNMYLSRFNYIRILSNRSGMYTPAWGLLMADSPWGIAQRLLAQRDTDASRIENRGTFRTVR